MASLVVSVMMRYAPFPSFWPARARTCGARPCQRPEAIFPAASFDDGRFAAARQAAPGAKKHVRPGFRRSLAAFSRQDTRGAARGFAQVLSVPDDCLSLAGRRQMRLALPVDMPASAAHQCPNVLLGFTELRMEFVVGGHDAVCARASLPQMH